MCKKLKGCGRKIDKCMYRIVSILNLTLLKKPYITIASCCGHGVYPPTLIVKGEQVAMDIYSGVELQLFEEDQTIDAFFVVIVLDSNLLEPPAIEKASYFFEGFIVDRVG